MDAEATALESDDRSWTYRELDKAVEQRAVDLHSGGVTRGCVVGGEWVNSCTSKRSWPFVQFEEILVESQF